MDSLRELTFTIIEICALSFIFFLGVAILWIAILYVIDKTQKHQTIRRNYPVIGRFRYFFEHLGEFFRQYFFAMDREELPFNRAERSWVYRAAKNVDSTVAFGSTRSLTHPGDVIFVNTPFPTLSQQGRPPSEIIYGKETAKHPYKTSSFFNISGMSYGAISRPAITALSHGAAKSSIWLNTGEGGVSKFHLESGCDIVYQIGTAKYGVRDENGRLSDDKLREIAAIEHVRMFEIKLSQGAKPGKGGILPGKKVTNEIAKIRGIPKGKDSISPNGHPEIGNVGDLLDMVNHIRDITGKPVGFKLVVGVETFFDDLFTEIHRRGLQSCPDFITIDSADGGTGAAPQSLMDYVGITIHESLPRVIDKLNEFNLKSRVRVIASGKLITPAQVAWALCMGADAVVSARGFMFALGCIQALQCNKNTCPTGITTHNKDLQDGLDPKNKATRVANYALSIVHEVCTISSSCGVPEPRKLQRSHARMITERNLSTSYSIIYPDVKPREEFVTEQPTNTIKN